MPAGTFARHARFLPMEEIMTNQPDIQRMWDIVDEVGVGMLTTHFTGGLRARPIEPRLDRKQGVIRFITDARGLKDDEIESAPDVGLVVISVADKAYLSISGRAEVMRD